MNQANERKHREQNAKISHAHSFALFGSLCNDDKNWSHSSRLCSKITKNTHSYLYTLAIELTFQKNRSGCDSFHFRLPFSRICSILSMLFSIQLHRFALCYVAQWKSEPKTLNFPRPERLHGKNGCGQALCGTHPEYGITRLDWSRSIDGNAIWPALLACVVFHCCRLPHWTTLSRLEITIEARPMDVTTH